MNNSEGKPTQDDREGGELDKIYDDDKGAGGQGQDCPRRELESPQQRKKYEIRSIDSSKLSSILPPDLQKARTAQLSLVMDEGPKRQKDAARRDGDKMGQKGSKPKRFQLQKAATHNKDDSDDIEQELEEQDEGVFRLGVKFAPPTQDQIFLRSLSEDSKGSGGGGGGGGARQLIHLDGERNETTPLLQGHRSSFKSNRAKRGAFQRLASMPGDSELNDYMDGLARDPNKFTNPHNSDTGETILHLLAKEGKIEILESLLEDPRVEKELVRALLQQDKLGWSPIMAATKADSGVEDIIEMFLRFLEPRLEYGQLKLLFDGENIAKDSIFTLLMRNNELFVPSRRILFQILTRYSKDPKEINYRILKMLQQLMTPNSCELTSRTMREIIDLSGEFGVDFQQLFSVKDKEGNNLLMELAKTMKDDALREILTNNRTANFITHSILKSKNLIGQTLLTLIEVNRESLSESLPLVLKREYGCHRRDMIKTELCLSEQLETSASASEIIQELHELEPKNWCQIFIIWATLFCTSLTPNIGLAFGDIFSDAYLVVEYHNNMKNETYNQLQAEECRKLKNETPVPLQAYASCLESNSQFYYTLTFLLIPLIFYLTEFITLRPEYEPTGLRNKLKVLYIELCTKKMVFRQYILKLCTLLAYGAATALALILWQPVTAFCKFYRDASYEASEGTEKVIRRKEKRYVDLAASRGELIEVSIEAVFEPMVQGYIIFPSIIDIIKRLSESIKVEEDGTLEIEFALKGIETAQIFSIGVSMVSLAWCFSEYHSVRKNMLLDITVSPCSRIIMCFFMLFQVIARLLAFMLFTLFWGPGNFYPLLIFIAIHMLIAAGLHIIFSEDIVYWKKGLYIKFLHNVMMNAFASIYFHNYLRFDEMPMTKKDEDSHLKTSSAVLSPISPEKIEMGPREEDSVKAIQNDKIEFIDSQRPGLHISTFLRQLMFDILYALEYVVLLAFGFSSKVELLMDNSRKPIIVSVILILSFLALGLKLFYYLVMHVWSKVILSGKKLTKKEFGSSGKQTKFNSRFFKYVFISRNTWILGRLRHIETTLIVLPTTIIEAIKGRGQDLEYNFTDVTKRVDTSWFSSPRELLKHLKLNNLILFLLFVPMVVLVIAMNVLIIVLLLVGLVLTIPVAILIFLYNLKSGFRAVEIFDDEEGQNTLELPPEIDRGETTIFKSDPSKTLVSIQKDLEETGVIDLHRKNDFSADELEVFSMLLLSLNRKRFPLKWLILDNCDITDEKLMKLAPLLVKFEKVSLNGSQKVTVTGWEKLANVIINPSYHSKLRVLELKIAKTDDDVIRFRREVLLEELKGSTMTADALSKISLFVPRLEKVYLDDIFNDSNILDIIKSRSDNILEAWKEFSIQIVNCPLAKRKLRCLSLPGCSINDEILAILSPALVRVKKIHLGRNSITSQGWQSFRNAFMDASSVHELVLTHFSLNAVTDSGTSSGAKLLHSPGMDQLSVVIPLLEEVDLSGQCEVGADGWTSLCNGLKMAGDKFKLKTLVLAQCKIKGITKTMLEEVAAKCQQTNLKVEFGKGEKKRNKIRKYLHL